MKKLFKKRFTRSSHNPRRQPRMLRLEPLEDRCLLATFSVTDLGDSGPGTLRQALLDANASAGADTIEFGVAGDIAVGSALPDLADASGGTTIDGTTALGYVSQPVVNLFGPGISQSIFGLRINGTANNVIRGLQFSNFLNGGIEVTGSISFINIIDQNYIGFDGIEAFPNGVGIQVTNGAGAVQITQNVIAGNTGDGVRLTETAGSGTQISNNSFFDNGGLAINLVSATDNAAGVTPNDNLDADSGPNDLQNAPHISQAVATGGGTSITYELHSTPNTFFLIQIYRSPAADPSGFGEGKTVLVNRGLTTDAGGDASETFLAGVVPLGEVITATAFSSSTSEFSNAATVAELAVWTGGGGTNNWSDPDNWGGTAPAAGDHLVFGAGLPTSTVNDFPAGTKFTSLTFNGGGYTLGGNSIELGSGGIRVAPSLADIDLQIDLHIDPICLPIVVGADSQLRLSGVISGAGIIEKQAAGTLVMSAANTYTGVTMVEEGVLRLEHGQALGSTAGDTEVGGDGTLELRGGIAVVGETLVVSAEPRTTDIIAILIGHNFWDGPVDLPQHVDPICNPIRTAAGTSLTISGAISGGSLSDLEKLGAGDLILSGANVYSGKTIVEEGVLRLEHGQALGSTAGDTEVGGDGTLELRGGIAVVGETLVVSAEPRTTDIIAILIGHNAWDGPVDLPQTIDPVCSPIRTAAGTSLTISGAISGGSLSDLEKLGAGDLILSGGNTYSGMTMVSDGTLRVDGSIATSSVIVDGGILGGTGIIGGTSILSGSLRPGASPGKLTASGDVSFSAGSSFDVELDGTAAGSQYDQLAVVGQVELAGATLTVSVGYSSQVGDRFTLIDNDGVDAVVGTFAGLPEGAILDAAGKPYRITYVGGDGNDVELLRLGVGIVAGDLIVDGTAGNDIIRVNPVGSSGAIEVVLNGVSQGLFTLTSGGKIIVHGFAGDDDIEIAGSINLSALLYGDAGNDRIKAGGGPSVLVGGDGDDNLTGGSGRDLLIGGLDEDRLVGAAGDDILIGGTTAHDTDDVALYAILAEWSSSRSYEDRVDNLRGTGAGPRANGDYFFKTDGPQATVFDDGAADKLTGSSGQDWFFAHLIDPAADKITGLKGDEFVESV